MSIHLAEGKCVALEVKCNNPNINCVCEFRQLCGPRDPVSRTHFKKSGIFYQFVLKNKLSHFYLLTGT